ncbi:right-handed parallel beta-helix repeat-containing protein [Pseudooceanicola sp.]|uniref:right-handed parallel beta-helix repeat-containing protein n=1 Tax=Pseudooceanicola sp. TaxID=1914328 RepID=UPI003513DB43
MIIDRTTLKRARRHARKLDAILTGLLTPAEQPEPEPVMGKIGAGTTQAEMLFLASGYVVEAVDRPEIISGKVIRTTGAGAAMGEFSGPAGSYQLEVFYFDESDGQSLVELWVDGQKVLSWVADTDDDALHRSSVDVNIEPGDVIEIKATPNAGEPARIDRIVITPLGDKAPQEPVEDPAETPVDGVPISNAAELKDALASAQGGEVFVLKDGDYGNLVLTGQVYGAPISITCASWLGAEFGEIRMTNCDGLKWTGIDVEAFRAYSSKNVGLVGSSVTGIVYMKDVDGLMVEGNDIEGNFHAMLLNDVREFKVTGNKVHGAQEDLMRITGDSHSGVVEENFFFDTEPEDYRNDGDPTTEGYNHSDFIQMFGANGKTPRDIAIRRNLMFDDRATGDKTVTPQGIFVSDPAAGGYSNLLIEENLIAVNSTNSIYINGGQDNVVVRNNSLIPLNGGGAIIRLVLKAGMDNRGTLVEGNACKVLSNESTAAKIGQNFVYGRDVAPAELFSGEGKAWRDYLPVAGSSLEASGMGAAAFLAEMAAGKVPAALR